MASRFVCIMILAWAVLLLRPGPNRSLRIEAADRPRLLAGAAIGYATYQLCSVFALDHSSVFTISLLVALVPLFTMMMMFGIGEALPPFGWIGLAIAVAGVVIFLSDKRQSGDSLPGAMLSLGAAVSFAAYGLINRPLVKRYRSDVLAAWQLLIGTIPMVLVGSGPAFDQEWSGVSLRIWAGLIFVIIFPVYVAYQLWNYAIAHRGAAVASSYGLVVPILSAIMAVIFFDEHVTWLKVLGAALAIAGLLIVRLPAGWRRSLAPVSP